MKVKVAQLCLTLQPHGLCSPWNSPGWNTGVGSLSLLQGIFPTQGSNPGLLHSKWILYQLSQKGSPRKLEWGSLSLLQGIFPTQESKRGFLHFRQILYQLSYQGSPKFVILAILIYYCQRCINVFCYQNFIHQRCFNSHLHNESPQTLISAKIPLINNVLKYTTQWH